MINADTLWHHYEHFVNSKDCKFLYQKRLPPLWSGPKSQRYRGPDIRPPTNSVARWNLFVSPSPSVPPEADYKKRRNMNSSKLIKTHQNSSKLIKTTALLQVRHCVAHVFRVHCRTSCHHLTVTIHNESGRKWMLVCSKGPWNFRPICWSKCWKCPRLWLGWCFFGTHHTRRVSWNWLWWAQSGVRGLQTPAKRKRSKQIQTSWNLQALLSHVQTIPVMFSIPLASFACQHAMLQHLPVGMSSRVRKHKAALKTLGENAKIPAIRLAKTV